MLGQNTTPGEPNGTYKTLWDSTEELRGKDLESPWQTELRNQVSNSYVRGRKRINFISVFSSSCFKFLIFNLKQGMFLFCHPVKSH